MIPVKQTTRGGADAPPEERGDCFSACLASLLELDLAEVPRFCELDGDWTPAINQWLAGLGLAYVELGYSDYTVEVRKRLGWHVVSGRSPRGHRHSVVAQGGELVHDPHMDVEGEPKLEPHDPHNLDDAWTIGVLIPLDPADWS